MDDDRPLQTEAAHVVDRVEELDAALRKLQVRVDELAGGRQPDEEAASPVVVCKNLSPAIHAEELVKLGEWVDWLQERYAVAGDWLRPCWWRHGFVVQELAALHAAWMAVYQSDEPAAPTAALKWHESAEKCRERIRQAIGTGPGCTAVKHRLDQPVTDDPRWAEERAALHRETPDLPGPPGAGVVGEGFAHHTSGEGRERSSNDGSPRAAASLPVQALSQAGSRLDPVQAEV